jgi:methyltransferase (TIGR00027 family)
MEQKSMTALISAFARWYHAEHNDVKIFDDSIAGKILSDDEKRQIAVNMRSGIGFFNPLFSGTEEETLRWIVDNQLSPSPLGRSAWAEKALQTAAKTGVKQYFIVVAGYDTFAYRQSAWASELRIFEMDNLFMSTDKQKRVQGFLDVLPENLTYMPINLAAESLSEKLRSCGTFNKNKLSFYSLLGIAYYLSKENFKTLLYDIADSASNGSTIVFDYPDEHTYMEQAGERAKKQAMMAQGAGEAMLASYSYAEMEQLLSDCEFLIYEHLTPDQITKQFFEEYNIANPQYIMTAFDNTNYCLAVKK